MTTDLHEFAAFARQAHFHMLERSGSFGHWKNRTQFSSTCGTSGRSKS